MQTTFRRQCTAIIISTKQRVQLVISHSKWQLRWPCGQGYCTSWCCRATDENRESYCPVMSCSGVVTSSTPAARHRGQRAVWPKFHLMRPNKGALDRVSVRPLSKEHERGLKRGFQVGEDDVIYLLITMSGREGWSEKQCWLFACTKPPFYFIFA